MLNKELIKELYEESNMMQRRANDIVKKTQVDMNELRAKAKVKIQEYFDSVLDIISDDNVRVEMTYNNSQGRKIEVDVYLVNKDNAYLYSSNYGELRYATLRIGGYSLGTTILVSSNNKGTIYGKKPGSYNETVNTVEEKYGRYNLGSLELDNDTETAIINFFGSHKEELDNAITEAIKKSISKKMNDQANIISNRTNHLNNLMNIIEE